VKNLFAIYRFQVKGVYLKKTCSYKGKIYLVGDPVSTDGRKTIRYYYIPSLWAVFDERRATMHAKTILGPMLPDDKVPIFETLEAAKGYINQHINTNLEIEWETDFERRLA
jgi:hypothetical protein